MPVGAPNSVESVPRPGDVSSMKSVYAAYSVGDPEWEAIEPMLPPIPTPVPRIHILRAESDQRKKLRSRGNTPSTLFFDR